MVQYFPVITGSLTVQGNVLITGSINTTAGITGSFSGTATTAQTASSVANLNQNVQITGSLTTSGTITAQTLVVSTISSSIEYASGSNIFGSNLSNTQKFTGSVLVTGSIGVATNPVYALDILSAASSSANIQAQFYNSDYGSGVRNFIRVRNGIGVGSTYSSYFGQGSNGKTYIVANDLTRNDFVIDGNNGYVGIGTASPVASLHVYGSLGNNPVTFEGIAGSSNGWIKIKSGITGSYQLGVAAGAFQIYDDSVGTKFYIASGSIGNVGIGTTSPTSLLTLVKDSNIGINTVDGSDNGYLGLCGAGADGEGRGGHIYLSGNERAADAGTVVLSAGNVSTGAVLFRTGAGTERMRINSSGQIRITGAATTDAASAYLENEANNGYFNIYAGGSGSSVKGIKLKTTTGSTTIDAISINSIGSVYFGLSGGGDLLFTKPDGTNYSIFLYTGSNSNVIFSGGSGGLGINNKANTVRIVQVSDGGNMTIQGTLTQNGSDERIKKNIQLISNALNKVNSLRGVTFEWNKDIFPTDRTTDIGVIAQDVQVVLPDAVTLAPFDTDHVNGGSLSGENYLTVYYEKLIPLLIESVKELSAKVDKQAAEIEALKAK